MTVWLPKGRKLYRYRFYIDKVEYLGNTKLTRKDDAEIWEKAEQLRVRRELAGIGVPDPSASPHIHDFAEIYFAHVTSPTAKKPLKRPEAIDTLLRVNLRFFGRQVDPELPNEPYHNLRLIDVVTNPDWIEKHEEWMRARKKCGPQSRNHYRSIMARLYRVAMLPKYRKATGISVNPFAGVERDRPKKRKVIITAAQLRLWIANASYHVRLAVGLAALTGLRLQNILGLRWSDLDAKWDYITLHDHKTSDQTGDPIVVPVSDQVWMMLTDAKARQKVRSRESTARSSDAGIFVVTYRGRRVKSIRGGVKAAAEDAGIHYGRDVGGATFHSLRHTAETVLAELGENPELRAELFGQDVATALDYTHLRPRHLKKPAQRLSKALPIVDLVTHKQFRARRKTTAARKAAVLGSTTGTKHRETRGQQHARAGSRNRRKPS